MLPPKPKSAPVGRIKSKRTSAMKEVELWVLNDTDFARETSRHSGNLAENITEERMLRTKLMDLGKERYKSLNKHNSEIHTFMDHQRKKFASFRRNRVSSQYGDRSKSSGYSTAHSILSKSDSTMTREELSAPIRTSYSLLIRPKTVQFDTNMRKGSGYISTGTDETRPNTMPGALDSYDRHLNGNGKVTSSPLGMYSPWSRPSTGGVSRATSSVSIGLSSIRSDSSRFGQMRSVNDQRYAKLEKALSLNYISRTKLDTRTIIEKIESLRKPVKGVENTEQSLDEKIKTFMVERGISFD